MNEIFLTLGLESWKPLLTALAMPPVPFLLLVLLGARQVYRRPLLGWSVIFFAVVALWMSCTVAMSQFLMRNLMRPQPPLMSSEIADLRKSPKTAIVVLGGGRRLVAPEYGISSLKPRTLERLRFGIWLSRETGLPIAFSGGVGIGAEPGATESEVAARVAEREFGRPLRWQETESRDTRENAIRTVALLAPQGIEKIVLVTHDYHIRRSVANFERAAEGTRVTVVPAPMGQRGRIPLRVGDWIPSMEGYEENWVVLREYVGRMLGA